MFFTSRGHDEFWTKRKLTSQLSVHKKFNETKDFLSSSELLSNKILVTGKKSYTP